MSSRGFLLSLFLCGTLGAGGFMAKEKESNAKQEDFEKAKIQIEEIEYLNHICEEHESCVMYDEHSNDEEGYSKV
jgi:hypothetical protein